MTRHSGRWLILLCVVQMAVSAAMLEKGAEGVLGAGFFGDDWGVETGTFAWR